MSQLSYEDQSATPALEGGLGDTGLQDVVSRTPGGNVKQQETITTTTPVESVAQVATLTLTTAADADAYTINIGDFTFVGTSSGTDSTAQAVVIRAQLDADADFAAEYTVSGATNEVIVTANRRGNPFGMYVEVESTSAWTWANTTPAIVGTQYNLTVGGHQIVYPAESTVAADESAAFFALVSVDSAITALVDITEPTTTTILLTAKAAGVPVVITFANENLAGTPGSGTLASAATTANVTGNPVPFGRGLSRGAADNVAVLPSATAFTFEGISVNRAKGRPKDTSVSPPVTGDAVYNSDESMPVLRSGRIWVRPETAVTVESGVFLRHSQGANAAHTPGRFRGTDVGAEVDEITQGARWISSASSDGLALLEIDTLAVISA